MRFETFIQDVSFGLRMLRKSQGFAAAAVLSARPGNRSDYGGFHRRRSGVASVLASARA
jgi:hypothetical protein